MDTDRVSLFLSRHPKIYFPLFPLIYIHVKTPSSGHFFFFGHKQITGVRENDRHRVKRPNQWTFKRKKKVDRQRLCTKTSTTMIKAKRSDEVRRRSVDCMINFWDLLLLLADDGLRRIGFSASYRREWGCYIYICVLPAKAKKENVSPTSFWWWGECVCVRLVSPPPKAIWWVGVSISMLNVQVYKREEKQPCVVFLSFSLSLSTFSVILLSKKKI